MFHLWWDVLTRSHVKQVHWLTSACVQALFRLLNKYSLYMWTLSSQVLNSHLVDDFALLGVRPVLLTALAVASCHLHLMRKIVSNPRTEKDCQKIEKGCWKSVKEEYYQKIEKDSWYWERICTIWESQIGSAPSHVVVGTERTLERNCLLDAARTFTSWRFSLFSNPPK